jgi:hypothetical protein
MLQILEKPELLLHRKIQYQYLTNICKVKAHCCNIEGRENTLDNSRYKLYFFDTACKVL